MALSARSVIFSERVSVAPPAPVTVTFTVSTSGPLLASSRAAARESLSVIAWVPAPSV